MSSSSSLKSELEGNWIIKLDFLSAQRYGVLSYCLRAAAASHFPFLLLHNTGSPLKSTTSPNKRGEKSNDFFHGTRMRGDRKRKEETKCQDFLLVLTPLTFMYSACTDCSCASFRKGKRKGGSGRLHCSLLSSSTGTAQEMASLAVGKRIFFTRAFFRELMALSFGCSQVSFLGQLGKPTPLPLLLQSLV